jgi:hypothetical protein
MWRTAYSPAARNAAAAAGTIVHLARHDQIRIDISSTPVKMRNTSTTRRVRAREKAKMITGSGEKVRRDDVLRSVDFPSKKDGPGSRKNDRIDNTSPASRGGRSVVWGKNCYGDFLAGAASTTRWCSSSRSIDHT